jgi:hypothetical protein
MILLEQTHHLAAASSIANTGNLAASLCMSSSVGAPSPK